MTRFEYEVRIYCQSRTNLKHRKNFQVAANRTILKIDAFHIAHFEADVPNFSKHLWNLAIPRKLWVPAHSEVRWSGTMTAKMSVFLPLFGRKWFVMTLPWALLPWCAQDDLETWHVTGAAARRGRPHPLLGDTVPLAGNHLKIEISIISTTFIHD